MPEKGKMKRAFIIHGWGGRPDAGWLAWINRELAKNDFKVYSPVMPDAENPKIDAWVKYLAKIVGKADENTYFIGHSIGCQTIIRYIESLPSNSKVGGVVFVAGWFTLKNLETEEEKTVSKPWLNTPIQFSKVKSKIKRVFALFSDDDPYVPVEDSIIFKEKLGAEVVIEKGKGHYIENVTREIPIILNKLLEMSK